MNLIPEQEMFTQRGKIFICWTRRLFMLTGALSLVYVGGTLLTARIFQNRASHMLERQMHAASLQTVEQNGNVATEGEILGRIEIPRIAMSVVVLQGTTPETLRLGVGHIIGTPLPGESGNIGIAGHRDTFFRGLKDIRRGDEILLRTASGVARYDVEWIQITAPGDGGIVASTTDSSLTLVTCYPFHYIGAAPQRYIVHARRQRDQPETYSQGDH
jgi:sortase A